MLPENKQPARVLETCKSRKLTNSLIFLLNLLSFFLRQKASILRQYGVVTIARRSYTHSQRSYNPTLQCSITALDRPKLRVRSFWTDTSSSAWTASRLVSFRVGAPSASTLCSNVQISIESAIRKNANEPSMVQRIILPMTINFGPISPATRLPKTASSQSLYLIL